MMLASEPVSGFAIQPSFRNCVDATSSPDMPELSHTIAYRAVVGAIHNTLHAHPRWSVPREFARSVAKRAAGTLMAHSGPSLLAASERSDRKQRLTVRTSASGQAKGAKNLRLLSRMHADLTQMIGGALREGDDQRYLDLVSAARIVKRQIQCRDGTKTETAKTETNGK
jgi:hypothetical protein